MGVEFNDLNCNLRVRKIGGQPLSQGGADFLGGQPGRPNFPNERIEEGSVRLNQNRRCGGAGLFGSAWRKLCV
ncbi:MAG: hypothetical protein ACD_54C00767G0001, partial [uncultured bacterium]